MYYVYVLFNEKNPKDTYVGYTSTVERRLHQHNAGENASTKGRQWKLVYYEAYVNEQSAREREHKLKANGRVKRFLFERIRKQCE